VGTGKASLPSVVTLAVGKEASFVMCLLEHSANKLTKGLAGGLGCQVLSWLTLSTEENSLSSAT
jgi:hypothetical protein